MRTRLPLGVKLRDLRIDNDLTIKGPENIKFDEKTVFPQLSDEELEEYYKHINAYIDGRDPSEFKLDLTNLKKHLL